VRPIRAQTGISVLNNWLDVAEFYFARRWDENEVPHAFYGAIRQVFGANFEPDLIHPVEREGSNDVALLMTVEADEAVLVEFEPPSTTTISFLGSLAGGMYAEIVRRVGEGRSYEIESVFEHERLGDRSLRAHGDPPPPTVSPYAQPGEQAARERTEQLRRTFRRWGATAEPKQPDQA
jgi:hypothetical protein